MSDLESDMPFQIIPSVLELRNLERALNAETESVLLSNTHIGNLAAFSKRAQSYGKTVMVTLESIGGFKPDSPGMQLLRNQFGVTGVFSSSRAALARAKRAGLLTFYRISLLDSKSVKNALAVLKDSDYDGIELLPSPVALHFIDLFLDVTQPDEVLAGGFVRHDNLNALQEAGFTGVTTSDANLWPK